MGPRLPGKPFLPMRPGSPVKKNIHINNNNVLTRKLISLNQKKAITDYNTVKIQQNSKSLELTIKLKGFQALVDSSLKSFFFTKTIKTIKMIDAISKKAILTEVKYLKFIKKQKKLRYFTCLPF